MTSAAASRRYLVWSIATVVLVICAVVAGCGGNNEATSRGESQPPRDQQGPSEKSVAPAPPSPIPGSKAAAPGVPTSRGGDNSIQTYGVEATAAERAELASLVRSYMDARARGAWRRACALLVRRQRRMFEQAAADAIRSRSPNCAAGMAALTSPEAAAVLAAESDFHVLSLRVGRKYAFLVYRRSGGKVYASALGREGSAWAVFSASPTLIR